MPGTSWPQPVAFASPEGDHVHAITPLPQKRQCRYLGGQHSYAGYFIDLPELISWEPSHLIQLPRDLYIFSHGPALGRLSYICGKLEPCIRVFPEETSSPLLYRTNCKELRFFKIDTTTNSSTIVLTTDTILAPMDKRDIFFFDVDDCLYSQDFKVDSYVDELIDEYISTTLGLSKEQSRELNGRYYQEYGLTVIGLQRFHQVDSMDFNRQVDDRLPMDKLLSKSTELIRFFSSFDRSKVKLWLFTNAHITHALRVAGLLGITHFFEGITYCDYSSGIDQWTCKPSRQMLEKAEREAGVRPDTRCFYVDDSIKNCTAATQRGWQVLWIQNGSNATPKSTPEQQYLTRIDSLPQIRNMIPHLFAGRSRSHPEQVIEESKDWKSKVTVTSVPIGLCAGA